jgi:hypothetical protein
MTYLYTRYVYTLIVQHKADIAWEDYISAPPGKHECLGRQYISKESPKSFKATVAVVSRILSNIKFELLCFKQ